MRTNFLLKLSIAGQKAKRFQPSGLARLGIAVVLSCPLSYGYTVLTHEAIIDSVWDSSLQKVLLRRFPDATPEDLEKAHGYAYGGSIIQDMGYYPFSSRFFSDLTHYVRSGDFIVALIRESRDLNEYAFALGALEHYAADTEGHRIATNRAVPILYPALRRKYGNDVTYWDNPAAHVRTEFGFDVLQVATGRYAPDKYRSFIGFEVSRDLLERAFQDTYGVEMKDVFKNVSLAIGTYRYGIRSVIPGMTRVAWRLKKDELQKEIPGVTRKKFLYNLSRSSYEKDWGKEYHKPGFGTRILTFIFRILPGGGPFTALRISTPTPEVEKLFMASFNATVDRYKATLANLEAGITALPNENFDAGGATIAGKYRGTDEAYAKLLDKLVDRKFDGMQPDLRENVLAYYAGLNVAAPTKATKKERAQFSKLMEQIGQLKAAAETSPAAQAP
ncbi:MAG: zinc dependent phospholipase C family protein [Bryobacteraceae bacterium]